MTTTLWLYVIRLEDDKYFLYDTYCSNEFEVLVIAHMNHDYMKKYKPVDIAEIMILEDHIEVLYYLKKYMAKYGIDSVRGGPYAHEFLSDKEGEFLENELSIENKTVENQDKEDAIKEIVKKYGTRHWSQIEIADEVKRLESIHQSYKIDIDKMTPLKWVNESILYDIGWIRKLCSQNSDSFQYIYLYKSAFYKKYNTIISKLKKITALFVDYGGSHIENDSSIYLKYPEFVFDNYIFSLLVPLNKTIAVSNEECSGSNLITDELCDRFELMVNTLINRRMDYEFHISGYEQRIEWKTERAIYFLTSYSQYII